MKMTAAYKYIICGVVILVSFLLGFNNGKKVIQAEWDAEKLQQAQLLNEANAKAKQIEQEFQQKLNEAQNERIKTEQLLQTARSATANAERRLSNATADFAKRMSKTTDKTCTNAITTSTKLFTECVARYRKMAENADGHFADFQQCDKAFPVNQEITN